MSLNLYDITVPTLQRALEQLLNILKQGEKWAEDNNVDKQKLIDGKLAPDMLPIPFQIQTVCNTTKNTLTRIGGKGALPAVEDNEKTLPELYARIEQTLGFLKEAEREKFVGADATVTFKMGPGEYTFSGIHYVEKFVLPNFFFHHSTAYLILRNLGVPLGKGVYLGVDTIQNGE